MDLVNPIVVDLSSDEESDKQVDGSDWLGEKPKSIKRRKTNSSDGDDDCVVLDGDPYKTTANENETDSCENDEVLVVGQKGEIACRDFPHPRHDCAEFPFNTISHDKYCEMCHCYVCDKRAPCSFWGNGLSSFDHCHANDKEERWIGQRECLRTGKLPPPPVWNKPQKLQQRLPSALKQFGNGIRACSTTRVATHPSTYTWQSKAFPQYQGSQTSQQQSFAFPQYHGLQARPAQLVSSNPSLFTQRPIKAAYPPPPPPPQYNPPPQPQFNPPPGYIPHATPLNPYAAPFNPQRRLPRSTSVVPESPSKMYAKVFNQNMYSSHVQTRTVPSMTTFPLPPQYQPQQQQQQPVRSKDKRLAEFEDWLMMDNPTATVPDLPLSGQDTATTTLSSDFEAFFWRI